MGRARTTRTRRVAEVGVGVALAGVLSAVVVWRAPQGGSVTPGAMVPLWILARRWGPGVGAAAGAVYGLLQVVLGATLVNPLQGLADYGLAFAGQGLAGWRRGGWPAGLALAGLARLGAHLLAAPAFFPGRPLEEALLGGLAYNLGFLVPEWILGVLLWRSLTQARPELDTPVQNADDLI